MSWYLSALLLLVAAPVAVALQSGDYTYTTNSAGQATITDFNTAYSGTLSITNTLGGCLVTAIGANAFQDCTGLTSVIVPNTVTNLGNQAFLRCTSLTNAVIGSGVTWIGNAAFQYCKLANVTIPDSVAFLGTSVFTFCYNLTNITVGVSNTSFSSLEGVLFNKSQTTLIQYLGGRTGSYTIPSCVSNIGEYAFYNCTNLASLLIGSGVTNVGYRALRSCSGLTNISAAVDNPVYSSIDGILFNKNKTVLIKCPGGKAGDYTITNSVTVVGEEAFHECRKLTGVTIPTSVTNLVGVAFDSCSGLTSIAIPESVINLGAFSFAHCSGLTSVTIPDSVTSIKDYALYDCSRLTNVVVGSKVNIITSYAFMSCPNLMGVYFKGNAPSIGTTIFNSSTNAIVYRLSTASGWPSIPDLWGGRPTALWGPVYYSLTVNGGSGSGSFMNGQQVVVTAYSPQPGCVFDRWTGATQYMSSMTSSTATVTMPGQDIALTATYKGNTYTVTFNAQGGTAPSPASKTVTYASNYGALATTARAGYLLNGWYTNAECSGSAVGSTSTVVIASNHTLYARWVEQTTTTTPVAVPYSWINQYPILLQVAGGNYEVAALIDLDLDGNLAWQEYVAGTDPTNTASVFRTNIEMIDGAPFITWLPNLGSARVYTVEGCSDLANSAWGPVQSGSRFFRVRVDLP